MTIHVSVRLKIINFPKNSEQAPLKSSHLEVTHGTNNKAVVTQFERAIFDIHVHFGFQPNYLFDPFHTQ